MIENESDPEVAAATSSGIFGASEFSSSAVSSFSRKYNALGGTFTHPAPATPGWGTYASGPQSLLYSNDNSTGQWVIAVAPGVPVTVATWWYASDNRSKVVDFQVLDGTNVVATVTLNQQLTPDAAATAASPSSISTLTSDPNATDNAGDPVPYAVLWAGTPTSHSLTVTIHKDASDTDGTMFAIADTLLAGSPQPIPQPAKVDVAQVGPSGRMIVLRLTDQIGNGAIVQSIDVTKPPTIQVNGGAGNGQSGSTGTIPLTSPIWEPAYQADPLSYVVFPTTFAIGTGDTVTVSVQDSWATTSAGACNAASGIAATNLVVGSLLPAFVPDSKSMRVGTNIARPDPSQPVMPFADLARQLGDWQDLSGHYDFQTDAHGNLTSLGSAPYINANVSSPAGDPADNTKWYPAFPADGVTTLVYSGGAAALYPNDGSSTMSIVSGPTTTNGVTTIQYRITKGANSNSPAVGLVVTAAPISGIHIYPPGVATDGSQVFHPQFLRMVSGYRCLRFMDALQTNSSTVVDFADFNDPNNLSYARSYQKTFGAPVVSVGPYANADGYFQSGGAIPILFTTGTPHGIKEGQFVSFAGFVGPGEGGTNPPGKFPVSNPSDTISLNGAISLAHIISPTQFAGRIGTNTVGAVAGQGLTQTYTTVGANARASGSSQIGWSPLDCVNLCNVNGSDLWINVPHAATDACVTAMFQLIASRLNPGLKVHVEYSNETWNYAGGFMQGGYCISQGNLAGLGADQWYVLRANQVHNLAAAVLATFGRGGDLVRVIGTQGGWYAGVGANRVGYAAANNIPFDELAIAPYFWSGPSAAELGAIFDTLDQEQFMDLAELYISSGVIDAFVQDNVDVLKAHYPEATVVCYEGGPEYGGLTGSADLGARSRAWARHPRMRGIVLDYLQVLQDHGCTLYNDYQLFGAVGAVANTIGANWPAYVAWNEVAGLGDGSDGLFDNRTNYEALDKIVSVIGGALNTWNALVPVTRTRALRMLLRRPGVARRG